MNVPEEAVEGIGGIDSRAAGHVAHQIDRLDPSAVRMGDAEPEARSLGRRGAGFEPSVPLATVSLILAEEKGLQADPARVGTAA